MVEEYVQRLGRYVRRHWFGVGLGAGVLASVVAVAVVIVGYNQQQEAKYHLSAKAANLVGKTVKTYSDKLAYDAKTQKYAYNKDYQPAELLAGQMSSPKFTATMAAGDKPAVSVTDPVSQLSIGFVPKFEVAQPRREGNRLVYPLKDHDGAQVFSLRTGSLKEDIILNKFAKDELTFEYELKLPSDLEARLNPDGSLGIYGAQQVLLGAVSTGSDADAALLAKAKQKSEKNNLIFSLPAPYVKDIRGINKKVKVEYRLSGTTLAVVSKGLKQAQYPLTIDPSVYVESAVKFMAGNNETNIDFDITGELIQKGVLTGARIEAWTATGAGTVLNAGRWNMGTAMAGGYVYVVGGSSGAANVANVYWAKLDTANYNFVSPTPGSTGGACTNWCTNTAYDLPATRSALSVVAYSGYLYAIGGKDAGCAGTNTTCSTVYVAKIGANGEPISWTTTSALSTARMYTSAAVYGNRIYVAGGQTNATLNGDTSVESAVVNPDGTLGTWSTTGMQAIPTAGRWGHTLLQYNGYLYLIGGSSTTTPANTVQMSRLTSTGTMNTWTTNSTTFTTARATYGGTFATIWGGYLYIQGGCSAMSTTNCTTIISSGALQHASINADGSLTAFSTVTGVSQTRTGFGLVAWRNTLYAIGGCATATTTSNCAAALTSASYGHINTDGNVSQKRTETTLPAAGNGAGTVGRMSNGVVINNGYLYNIGGCIVNNCATMSDNTAYASISSDGTVGAWTVDSTHSLNGTVGLGAFGVTTYNNTIYVVGGTGGGTSGSGNGYKRSIWHIHLNTDGSLDTGGWLEDTLRLTAVYGYAFTFTRALSATTGNIYFMGGCSSTSAGVGCSTYRTEVWKCTITNSTGGVNNDCAATSQLQLVEGLGLVAGAIHGNYIYLCGGANAGGDAQTDTCFFAEINTSNNIVRVDNGAATGGWQTATGTLPQIRRRATGFAANGYMYVVGGHDGSVPESLDDVVYAKIDQTTGDLGAFTTSTTTISERWNLGSAAANGFVYAVGGCTQGDPPTACDGGGGTGATDGMNGVVESVQVHNNYSGSPKAYAATGLFTTDRYGASAVATGGYIYVAGGCTTTVDCQTSPGTGTFTNTTAYAQLASDGTIASWTAGPNLPANRTFGCMVAQGGYLYYMGGRDGATAAFGTVYYSQLTAGVPGAWSTATMGIGDSGGGAQARMDPGCAVFNNFIYVTGGSNATPTYQTTVYVSPSLPTGGNITGNWASTTAFATARSGHVLVAYGATLYLLGGYDGTNYLMDVQFVNIASNGTVGTWEESTTLPQAIRQGTGFALNGYLYVFGGRSASTTCTNNTYVAPISGYAPGSASRYGLGSWSQTIVNYTGTRYGVAAAYDSGRVYLLGGQCNATLTGANRVVYSTLQSQPQVANYSLAIDTDTNVFPAKWLMNGVDNGTGAQWQLNYQSAATGGTPTWGQNTNAGTVTLGTPGTYTPLDGGGADLNATTGARYYFLGVSVDASQAFGYPEDVTRGPTVTDITLEFSADPGKRLHHGKTFTGGILQPLEAPF